MELFPSESYGAISASKVEEGYPDAVLAFYGRSAYQSVTIINLQADSTNKPLQLQFGSPQRTISWLVIDSMTGKAVSDARAYLQRADNPEITGSDPYRRANRSSSSCRAIQSVSEFPQMGILISLSLKPINRLRQITESSLWIRGSSDSNLLVDNLPFWTGY